MKTYNIFRYGLMKRLKRGVSISIYLTFRCTQDCSYCTCKMATGKMPEVPESILPDLIDFILRFPYRIREVQLTGGSPELHPTFACFVNWLLFEGYFVTVFSNLDKVDVLSQIDPSNRFMIIATFHKNESPAVFERRYNLLKKQYRINVEELGHHQLLPYSTIKDFVDVEYLKNDNSKLRITPDLRIVTNCYDAIKPAKQ